MLGNLGDLTKLMKQAKDIKANMAKMKDELANSSFSAIDSNSLVKVTVSGEFAILNIEILSGNLDGDAKMFAKIVQEATNNALLAAKNSAFEKMREATGGIDIPGMF